MTKVAYSIPASSFQEITPEFIQWCEQVANQIKASRTYAAQSATFLEAPTSRKDLFCSRQIMPIRKHLSLMEMGHTTNWRVEGCLTVAKCMANFPGQINATAEQSPGAWFCKQMQEVYKNASTPEHTISMFESMIAYLSI